MPLTSPARQHLECGCSSGAHNPDLGTPGGSERFLESIVRPVCLFRVFPAAAEKKQNKGQCAGVGSRSTAGVLQDEHQQGSCTSPHGEALLVHTRADPADCVWTGLGEPHPHPQNGPEHGHGTALVPLVPGPGYCGCREGGQGHIPAWCRGRWLVFNLGGRQLGGWWHPLAPWQAQCSCKAKARWPHSEECQCSSRSPPLRVRLCCISQKCSK